MDAFDAARRLPGRLGRVALAPPIPVASPALGHRSTIGDYICGSSKMKPMPNCKAGNLKPAEKRWASYGGGPIYRGIRSRISPHAHRGAPAGDATNSSSATVRKRNPENWRWKFRRQACIGIL